MDELREAMAARIGAEAGEGVVPGLVMAVADDAGVRVEVLGRTAFEGDGEPMRRETPFLVTSFTKPMVGAVAMTLIEEGVLDPAEPVERFLPELASPRVLRSIDADLDDTVAARRAITVEDVLTSRMGHGLIPAGDGINPDIPVVRYAKGQQLCLAEPDPRSPLDPDEWMRRFAAMPLLYQPGTRWAYNTSSLVLGVLVARAAGKPLPEVLRERLFEPLGMTSTGFAAPRTGMPALYMGGQRQTLQDWSVPPSFPSGAAGLVSTVDDVVAFGRSLLAGGPVLDARAVTAMTTNRLTGEQIAAGEMFLDGRGWGYNIAVGNDGSYGWDGGYGTRWFNRDGRVCVLLTQVSDVLWDGTADEFAELAR